MLDYRIQTFLTLCTTMNYRKTAQLLHMTQPAVTQHIHYLENYYQTKLFIYQNKKLSKTKDGEKLENYAKSLIYKDTKLKTSFQQNKKQKVILGATKTIGDYAMYSLVEACLKNDNIDFELIIDNTHNLLTKLNHHQVDLLIVEGYFDKEKYDYQLYRNEALVGICAIDHPFANKAINLDAIFNEVMIIREKGSGTRKVLEHFLENKNYTLDTFSRIMKISSLHLIQEVVSHGLGISFVYESCAKVNPKIAMFHIKNEQLQHEFNYVCLKDTNAISSFKEQILQNP